MFFVYILRSLKDKRHYIGYTGDLDRRIKDHNKGKNRSVRGRGPFQLIYKEEFKDALSAQRREKEIKSYKGGNAFKKLIRGPIV